MTVCHIPEEEKHQVHRCENRNKSLSTFRSILHTPATDMALLNQLTGQLVHCIALPFPTLHSTVYSYQEGTKFFVMLVKINGI